tara:strand:- start:2179 stop:2415 length:237 start_codon:yes stop_codon:yes gene_type:complete
MPLLKRATLRTAQFFADRYRQYFERYIAAGLSPTAADNRAAVRIRNEFRVLPVSEALKLVPAIELERQNCMRAVPGKS